MVDTQVRPSDVTKFPIIEAMLAVPREDFVPASRRDTAYVGENIALGGDRVLLDPRTFAKMLEALDLKPSDVVLDLGCGLGYSTAILARMTEFVVGVESDAARAEEAQALLSSGGTDNAAVMAGALKAGAAKSGPYDAIIIQGAVEDLPGALISQLKVGGRIVCLFVAGALGEVRLGRKTESGVNWRPVFNASAPLIEEFSAKAAFAL